MSERFAEQAVDQKLQAENLKTALRKLEHKMAEAQAKCELLLAQDRRSRGLGKASDAHAAAIDGSKAAAFDRMQHKVARIEAVSAAKTELAAGDEMEARLEAQEKQEKIERVLVEIKARKSLPS